MTPMKIEHHDLAAQNLSPPEVLQNIFSYIAAYQPTLHACTLVSNSWYKSSIAFLYHSPAIDGRNFDKFVEAICPSVNAHIRINGLATLVRKLDMSLLVHNGSKSLTARILGRVKEDLEEFVAPQASFAVNCLAALSKCHKLRRLNLSFVSESIAMSDLLRSMSTLSKLEILHLPRSSAHNTSIDALIYGWPSGLRELHISGGLRDESALSLSALPSSLTHLSISNCPHLSMLSIRPLVKLLGPQLQYLEIVAPLPNLNLGHGVLTNVMDLAPNLHHLKISMDFLGVAFFSSGDSGQSEYHFLKQLDLDCFEPADCISFHPNFIADMIVGSEGKFSKLRKLGVHKKLGWTNTGIYILGIREIDAFLKALAREDGDDAEITEDDAGVVFFGTP
ncbi:hypothetical protein N7G274_009329 [Stereocaulon virgatum]|uniref:F-box domain-containing protein n=1 Tax=Stereocaulon virgatum TaxID=373712 RepID=A0ABR3ZXF4_9LECA